MATALFQPALCPAIDSDGDTLSGATWTFYEPGTLVKTPVYSDALLSTQLSNPVVADSAGVFVPIYLDRALTYRAVLRDAQGAAVPGRSIDPYYPSESPLQAVFLVTYGQSPNLYLANQVTPGPITGLYMFRGGTEIEEFDSYSVPTSNRDITQVFSNYDSIVPWAPASGLEIMAAGIGAQILQETNVSLCLIFAPGFGGQSARMLRQGTNLFRDLENGLCQGVKILEALGYAVDIRFVWNQGHANADTQGDGLGGGETPTTVAQYKLILEKMRDAFWRAARTAKGELVSPSIGLVPLQTAGTSYAAVNVRDIQEAQRQAVATLSGWRYTPPYSQFVNNFQTDLVHPYGEAIRPHGEAVGLAMQSDVTPPLMTAATIVNSTTVDVTFNQDVEISASLAEATGYTNDAKGFQAITSGGAYVSVTAAAAHPTAANKIRLTVATATLAGGKILNGQQWAASGDAATYMPRTHVVGTTPLGTSLIGGTVLENFSIPQAIATS